MIYAKEGNYNFIYGNSVLLTQKEYAKKFKEMRYRQSIFPEEIYLYVYNNGFVYSQNFKEQYYENMDYTG